MGGRTRRRKLSAALIGAVALLAAGCGSSGHSSGSTPGVTKDSITIAISGPYSGVDGVVGQQTFSAAKVWEDQVNASGGINGRKVNLVQVDNQFTPEGAIAACKQVESSSIFLEVNTIDPGNEVGCENAAGIPVFVTATGLPASTIMSYKNVIFDHAAVEYPSAEVSFLGSSYMNARGKKIGIFMGSGPTFTAWYSALRAELSTQGYDVVAAERTDPSGIQTSYVSQLERLRQAGAQVVMLDVVLEVSGILRDTKAIGYSPEFELGPLATMDFFAQTAPSLYQGVKGVSFEATSETPAYATWVSLVRQYLGPAAAQTTTTTNASFYGVLQVVGHVLDSLGKNPTRAAFVAAAKSVDNFTGSPDLIGPFTTKGQALPVAKQAVFPVSCCNANHTFKLLGPPEANF